MKIFYGHLDFTKSAYIKISPNLTKVGPTSGRAVVVLDFRES